MLVSGGLTLHERRSRDAIGRFSANENWRIARYNETNYKNATRAQSAKDDSCELYQKLIPDIED